MKKSVFVGLLPLSRTIQTAVLSPRLDVVYLGEINLNDLTDLLEEADQASIAVSSPRSPNRGLMAQDAYRDQLDPRPHGDSWRDGRVAEFMLHTMGVPVKPTGGHPEKLSKAVKAGFEIFRLLDSLTTPEQPDGARAFENMETHSEGAFRVLLEQRPFPKSRLEGRLQRQLLLYRERVNVPDPMRVFEEITRHRLLQGNLDLDGLHTPQELDALMAAYVAQRAAHQPNGCIRVGDQQEGQIVLPAVVSHDDVRSE